MALVVFKSDSGFRVGGCLVAAASRFSMAPKKERSVAASSPNCEEDDEDEEGDEDEDADAEDDEDEENRPSGSQPGAGEAGRRGKPGLVLLERLLCSFSSVASARCVPFSLLPSSLLCALRQARGVADLQPQEQDDEEDVGEKEEEEEDIEEEEEEGEGHEEDDEELDEDEERFLEPVGAGLNIFFALFVSWSIESISLAFLRSSRMP